MPDLVLQLLRSLLSIRAELARALALHSALVSADVVTMSVNKNMTATDISEIVLVDRGACFGVDDLLRCRPFASALL